MFSCFSLHHALLSNDSCIKNTLTLLTHTRLISIYRYSLIILFPLHSFISLMHFPFFHLHVTCSLSPDKPSLPSIANNVCNQIISTINSTHVFLDLTQKKSSTRRFHKIYLSLYSTHLFLNLTPPFHRLHPSLDSTFSLTCPSFFEHRKKKSNFIKFLPTFLLEHGISVLVYKTIINRMECTYRVSKWQRNW